MFKYKCTSRYKMLIVVENEVQEVRPQEIIHLKEEVKNKFLKRIYMQKTKVKEEKKDSLTVKQLKVEKTNASSHT